MIYKNKKVLKLADCSQTITPEASMVKGCITKQMLQLNSTFKWPNKLDNGRKDFYDCLDQVFKE